MKRTGYLSSPFFFIFARFTVLVMVNNLNEYKGGLIMKEFFKGLFDGVNGVIKTAIISATIMLTTIIVLLGILIGILIV